METKVKFIELSACKSNAQQLRSVLEDAQKRFSRFNNNKNFKKTIVFIDEIHRFNKAQQDLLLPYIENGSVYLIGATTENPR